MPRPRFQFGVRTLLVVVTLAGVIAAFISYHVNWIRQRREFAEIDGVHIQTVPSGTKYSREAPGLLWLFGERGIYQVNLFVDSNADLERGKELFPEADVTEVHPIWPVGDR